MDTEYNTELVKVDSNSVKEATQLLRATQVLGKCRENNRRTLDLEQYPGLKAILQGIRYKDYQRKWHAEKNSTLGWSVMCLLTIVFIAVVYIGNSVSYGLAMAILEIELGIGALTVGVQIGIILCSYMLTYEDVPVSFIPKSFYTIPSGESYFTRGQIKEAVGDLYRDSEFDMGNDSYYHGFNEETFSERWGIAWLWLTVNEQNTGAFIPLDELYPDFVIMVINNLLDGCCLGFAFASLDKALKVTGRTDFYEKVTNLMDKLINES